MYQGDFTSVLWPMRRTGGVELDPLEATAATAGFCWTGTTGTHSGPYVSGAHMVPHDPFAT